MRPRTWPPYPDFVRDLQARIMAWDPVQLADFEPPLDEYDFVVTPLSGWLRAGLGPDEVASRLTRLIEDHFAITPTGTDAFAAASVAWYRTVDPAGD